MTQSYKTWQNPPVAKKTMIEGFTPEPTNGRRPHLVAVVAFDGVVLGDLSTACEVFGLAKRKDGRTAYEVRVCSESENVESMHVALRVPWRLSSLARADTVIVPGINDLNRPIPASVLPPYVVRPARRPRRVDLHRRVRAGGHRRPRGLRATTHWLAAADLARRHPSIDLDANVLYVDNGRVLTSAGAAAGFDLCIHMVRRDLGADIAASVARLAVMPLERAGGRRNSSNMRRHPNARRHDAVAHMDGTEPLARAPAASHRAASGNEHENTQPSFSRAGGTTPAAWLAQARVRRAQRLLETTDLAIEQVRRRLASGLPP